MSANATWRDVLSGDAEFAIYNGDTVKEMARMPEGSIDFAVFSPPFPSVYSYNPDAADIGNSEDDADYMLGFLFFFRQLLRVMKPGRVVLCHCMQIPRLKRSGRDGLSDFRGTLIKMGERAGFTYEYDWMSRQNPQMQAMRTHSHELQFAGLEKDRANTRGCLCDYLIKFQVPGENAVPVDSPEVSRNDWIAWAEGFWSDISPSDTLNTAEAKHPDDTRHVCPLALGIYRRAILLYTNPGECVLDPFAGIGSCGYVALGGESPRKGHFLEESRRFIGTELKDTYHATAIRNCERAIKHRKARQRTLFDALEETEVPCNGPAD